jgi:outer membrane protein TolC
MSSEQIHARATADLATLFKDQEPVEKPLTLYQAMARAIKYNLNYRLKIMEQALSNRQLDVLRYDLLPAVTASAGYRTRSNASGSTSQSLLTGRESLEPSTSEERDIRTAGITMTWNVLDFGVSYVRAKQQADQVMIAEEKRRKVIQNIIQDVNYAYWSAVSSERLIKDMTALMKDAQSALDRSRIIETQGLRPQGETLVFQREILENIRILWDLVQRLEQTKKELAALININPGLSFTLAEPDWQTLSVPVFNMPIDALERLAMETRPELREMDYTHRISVLEVRKAMLKMLPGIELNFGYHYNSNDFLFNNTWNAAGSLISWNILNIFSGPSSIRLAKTQGRVAQLQRQALSMAVLAQVHLALQRFGLAEKTYGVTRELDDVYGRIHEQTKAGVTAGGENELTLIRSATNAMVATIRSHQAYADLQNAMGRIYNSIGTDLLFEQVEVLDVDILVYVLEKSFC